MKTTLKTSDRLPDESGTRVLVRFYELNKKDWLSWLSYVLLYILYRKRPTFVHVALIVEHSYVSQMLEYSLCGLSTSLVVTDDEYNLDYTEVHHYTTIDIYSRVTSVVTFHNYPSLISVIANLLGVPNAPNCSSFVGSILHVYPNASPDILFNSLIGHFV